jgi:hypothetical protein
MIGWDQRPFETKNLFNPAFCAVVLMRSLKAYATADPRGMPFSLSLLILPLSLHYESRSLLMKLYKGYLLKTVETNPQLQIGLPERVTEMLPFTFEAFALAHHTDCFEVTPQGRLLPKARRLKADMQGTEESVACQRAAMLLGREFARIADRVTVYTAFGIRP